MVDIVNNSQVVIGHGSFSIVYKACLKERPNQTVAIKAITKKHLAKSQNLLGKEIKILKELTLLQHENVVALLDCKETPNHVYLVMEYCNGGDLADYLNAKGTLSEDTIRSFLRQLAGAMKAMVSKDIVHRDLKPQNILLSHDGRTKNPQPQDINLKIADFGFARFLQDGVMAATLCGSPMYMAPEVIMSLQYNSKADLWSLGTIVFQCLTGKAPFQAQTPQALKHYYEKNANLAPRIPRGTSDGLTNLLTGLLKRDARERMDFDTFFNHPFIRPAAPQAPPPPPVQHQAAASRPVKVPASGPSSSAATTPRNSAPCHVPLPPSPVNRTAGFAASPPPTADGGSGRTSRPKRESGSSPPDSNAAAVDPDDFVMVPAHLTMDAAENRKKREAGPRSTPDRPGNLPVNVAGPTSDPIPVPTQKAAYQQIQQSLVRSRSRSGDSVSAMSGISSASGGSTLGPLPEDKLAEPGSPAPSGRRKQPRVSPLSSPRAAAGKSGVQDGTKSRRVSVPDICQMSPPSLQFAMGGAQPPARRRTSSSSSCGTPPPSGHWQISPNSPGGVVVPSPSRRAAGQPAAAAERGSALSPIQGSPNKAAAAAFAAPEGSSGSGSRAVMQWDNNNAGLSGQQRAFTVPDNLSAVGKGAPDQLQLVSGRNVVLNYGAIDRSSSWSNLSRRAGSSLGKENAVPPALLAMPPPALSEETLMAPEHNEILGKLRYISVLVDTIVDVARNKAAPLSAISETVSPVRPRAGDADPNSPVQRRLQQLLLYTRCLHILSQTLDFSRAELKAKKLKPSTSVKNTLATLNERFRHCISMTKMLNSESLLADSGLQPHSTAFTADKILYSYAIEQCQSAALDELFGNPEECFQRYHGAHVLLHALQFQSQNDEDRKSLAHYKEAVEKRLHILEQQGFVQTYETATY